MSLHMLPLLLPPSAVNVLPYLLLPLLLVCCCQVLTSLTIR
jgi:hypothetical protein